MFTSGIVGNAVNSGYCFREQGTGCSNWSLGSVQEGKGLLVETARKAEAEVKRRLEELRILSFSFIPFTTRGGGAGIKCEIRAGEHTPYLFIPEMSGESSDWMLTAVINKYRYRAQRLYLFMTQGKHGVILCLVWNDKIRDWARAPSPDQPSASYFRLYIWASPMPRWFSTSIVAINCQRTTTLECLQNRICASGREFQTAKRNTGIGTHCQTSQCISVISTFGKAHSIMIFSIT